MRSIRCAEAAYEQFVSQSKNSAAECEAFDHARRPCMSQKTALIMAGGTGGHIFPGLAVAEELRARGWRVHWLGAPGSMESRIVPQHGFPLELIDFSGVRGKGLATLALLPLRLLRAFWQALQVVRRVKPDVVVGLGGYITFPGRDDGRAVRQAPGAA
jgi:UDP:flavonoid glycosyltransferase YjiC (YdhE family)